MAFSAEQVRRDLADVQQGVPAMVRARAGYDVSLQDADATISVQKFHRLTGKGGIQCRFEPSLTGAIPCSFGLSCDGLDSCYMTKIK